ncbi:MAG: Hsp20 family protein [Methylococcales bacterium]
MVLFNNLTKDFDKFFIGFDDQFNKLSKIHDDLTKNIPSYPPYNIKKTGDNTYVIELAVAGVAKQDIEIELADGKMIIKGNIAGDTNYNSDRDETYLFKGIATRGFTRTFALDDQIEVQNAELFNGMLKVFLERIIPEHKKPKKVEVKDTSEGKSAKKSKPELLVEDSQG